MGLLFAGVGCVLVAAGCDSAAVQAPTSQPPIVMTSFAFILGVAPLVLATGAGAEMRRTLGTSVFSGMLGVTAFGLLLTPVFYYVIERLRPQEIKQMQPAEKAMPSPSTDGQVTATASTVSTKATEAAPPG